MAWWLITWEQGQRNFYFCPIEKVYHHLHPEISICWWKGCNGIRNQFYNLLINIAVALFIFVWFTFRCVSMCILYLVKEQLAFALMSVNSCIGSPNSQLPTRPMTFQSPRYRRSLERNYLMPAYLLLKLRNFASCRNRRVRFVVSDLNALVVVSTSSR
jgi:hypothetical protein